MEDNIRWRPREGERLDSLMGLTVQLGERFHAVVERGGSIEGTGCSGQMLNRLMSDGHAACSWLGDELL